MTNSPLLSIIIPARNEKKNLAKLLKDIDSILQPSIPNNDYEIIIIDDHSNDTTTHHIQPQKAPITIVSLNKHYGQYTACKVGLNLFKGECCTIIASDGQDCPSTLPDMLAHWKSGHPLIKAARYNSTETGLLQWGRIGFYKLIALWTQAPSWKELLNTDFYLADRSLIKTIVNTKRLPKKAFVTAPTVHYNRPTRQHGKTNYSPLKLCKLCFKFLITINRPQIAFSKDALYKHIHTIQTINPRTTP